MSKTGELALSYDDICLLPKFSDIDSRKDCKTDTFLSRNIRLKYPMILSPMDTVSTVKSCVAMNEIGAAGILHRFMPVEEQAAKTKEIKDKSGKSYSAIGLKDVQNRLEALDKSGCDLFFLDTANGLSKRVFDFTKWYYTEKKYKQDLIVGNTLTKESVSRLINLGADGVRHGIAGGSVCITGVKTGIFCPSLTTLYWGYKAVRNWKLYNNDWGNKGDLEPTILMDGGIRYPKDLVKAICAGADAVICGGIFAGCLENSEKIVELNGKKMVKYRGCASLGVVEDYGLSDGTEENLFVEGETTYKPFKNKSVKSVVYEFCNGLKSGMSYLNITNLQDLKGGIWNDKVIYMRVTANSLYESFAHGKKD